MADDGSRQRSPGFSTAEASSEPTRQSCPAGSGTWRSDGSTHGRGSRRPDVTASASMATLNGGVGAPGRAGDIGFGGPSVRAGAPSHSGLDTAAANRPVPSGAIYITQIASRVDPPRVRDRDRNARHQCTHRVTR